MLTNTQSVALVVCLALPALAYAEEPWEISPKRLAVSNDGKWIAVGCDDRKVRVWNAETLGLVHEISVEQPVSDVPAVAIAQKDQANILIAGTGGLPRDNLNFVANSLVFAWQFDGEEVKKLWTQSMLGAVLSLASHPRGESVSVYTLTNRIQNLRLNTGEPDWTLFDSGNPGSDVAWSSDGAIVISAGPNCYLWDITKVRTEYADMPGPRVDPIVPLREEQAARCRSSVGHHGRLVTTARKANWAISFGAFFNDSGIPQSLVWIDMSHDKVEVLSRDISENIAFPIGPTCLAIEPNDRFFAVGTNDGTIRVFSVEKKLETRRFKVGDLHELRSMQFLSEGKQIVVTNRGGTRVLIADAESGEVETVLPYGK